MDWKQLLLPTRQGEKTVQKGTIISNRSPFEADYDRIIFSYPFRQLQDKTQVFPLPEQDFVHNRLTHSLEVSSVGRTLGRHVGEQLIAKHKLKQVSPNDFATIVSAAALAHDVGNPPFGHSGEAAISAFFKEHPTGQWWQQQCNQAQWADLTRFEGNAQGFRLINQKSLGLTLTYATLGAFTKYPKPAHIEALPGRTSQKKFGYFQSEAPIFTQLAQALQLTPLSNGAYARYPLAFLVEAADDICYHIIDLEDGCTLGLLSLDETIELLKPIVGIRFDKVKLMKKQFLHEKLGTLRALAINELIQQVVQVFMQHEAKIAGGSFDQPLTDLIPANQALKAIKEVSVNHIYRAQVVVEKEVAGYEVLHGLLEVYVSALTGYVAGNPGLYHKMALRTLPQPVRKCINQKPYMAIRTLLDYLSGMTDRHALASYRKLKGMALPSW